MTKNEIENKYYFYKTIYILLLIPLFIVFIVIISSMSGTTRFCLNLGEGSCGHDMIYGFEALSQTLLIGLLPPFNIIIIGYIVLMIVVLLKKSKYKSMISKAKK